MKRSELIAKIQGFLEVCRNLLCTWLDKNLPKDAGWWKKRVINMLSGFQRNVTVVITDAKTLSDLDLSELIYVATRNWDELKGALYDQSIGKKVLFDLKDVRNKYSHVNNGTLDKADALKDLNTVRMFLTVFYADYQIVMDVRYFMTMLENEPIEEDYVEERPELYIPKTETGDGRGGGRGPNPPVCAGAEDDPNEGNPRKQKKAKSKQENPEQRIFWNMYQKILDGCGNPFTICHREDRGYAAVNSTNSTTSKAGPILEFLTTSNNRVLRASIYIVDDTKTPYYDRMYADKDEIEKMFGHSLIWKSGDKNPNTKRIQYEIPYGEKDIAEGYVSIIKQSIPIVQKFVKVAEEYIF